MIDTLKIYSMINKKIFENIKNNSDIKTAYNKSTGEVYYEVINNSISGAYNSNISIRIGNGSKYNFINQYYIEVERLIS